MALFTHTHGIEQVHGEQHPTTANRPAPAHGPVETAGGLQTRAPLERAHLRSSIAPRPASSLEATTASRARVRPARVFSPFVVHDAMLVGSTQPTNLLRERSWLR